MNSPAFHSQNLAKLAKFLRVMLRAPFKCYRKLSTKLERYPSKALFAKSTHKTGYLGLIRSPLRKKGVPVSSKGFPRLGLEPMLIQKPPVDIGCKAASCNGMACHHAGMG
eukprot:317625-Pelagomonas_calceolata.AAC.1